MIPPSHVTAILDALGAPAQLQLAERSDDLLRFARSRVTYQHSERATLLRVRIERDGRMATGTLGTLELPRVAALRERLEAALDALPRNVADPLRGQAVRRDAVTDFAATRDALPADRAALLAAAIFALPAGCELGGSLADGVVEETVANTAGLLQQERRTRSALQAVAQAGDRSSYRRILHRDRSVVVAELPALQGQIEAGLRELPRVTLEVAPQRAVLGPTAVATFVATLGQIAFSARAYATDQSAYSGRRGERVASPLVTLVDDGADPRGLPTTFDCDGAPKRRVALLEAGVFRDVVGDDARSTGHAVPVGWRFGAGPAVSHLVLHPGDASDDALLRGCGDGVAVQRVDYVRVVNARLGIVTGTTRDATFLISGGRIVGRVPQFRFTLRLPELFGAVEQLGDRLERSDTPFCESVAVPAMLVSAFPVESLVA